MTKSPNFLVIMTDQLRADHLGCYGNDIVKTPNIDKLANRGLQFDQFYVANPVCQPNRAALLTGQMTSVNGCRQNGIPVSRSSTTYADVLRQAGYRTGLVGKAHFQNVSHIPARTRPPLGEGVDPEAPCDLAEQDQRRGPEYQTEIRSIWIDDPQHEVDLPYYGFDHLRLCIGHGDQVEGHYTGWVKERLNGKPDPRGRKNAIGDAAENELPQIWRTAVPEELYPTTYVKEEALNFLTEEDERPFLLVASFPDPHHPFTPPGKYFDMYDPKEIELPESFSHPTGQRTDLPDHVLNSYRIGEDSPDGYWPFHPDADHLRKMIALNYGAITMIDDAIGEIIDQIEQSDRDTVICFMSDHGDFMGDHGTILKQGVHSQGVIRVPFIWADPATEGQGTTKLQGSAIDFAPTLLQRAGIRIPVGMQGRDLLAPDAVNQPVLIEDSGGGTTSDPEARCAIFSLVHEGWRLSLFEGSELAELYDLGRDPHELDNLWANSDPNILSKKTLMLQLLALSQLGLRDRTLLSTNQA